MSFDAGGLKAIVPAAAVGLHSQGERLHRADQKGGRAMALGTGGGCGTGGDAHVYPIGHGGENIRAHVYAALSR
jgi:hypothetical protein